MTKSSTFRVNNISGMNDSQFCQFIPEKEDDIDPEVLTAPSKTNIPENTTSREGTETMPIRKRATTPTPTPTDVLSITSPKETRPVTTMKPPPFFPAPPPMFASGMIGGKPSGPSTGAAFNPDFMFCGFIAEEKDVEASPLKLSVHENDKDDLEYLSDSESNSMDSDDKKAFLQTTFQLTRQQQKQIDPSDILVLRSLIRAIPGVRKVSIPESSSAQGLKNVTVHHDAAVHTITLRHAFESAGYSASISQGKPETSNGGTIPKGQDDDDCDHEECWVQSSFDVQGICCASEIPAIRRIVKPLSGVAKVNINLMTKVVLVQHDHVRIQASQIAESLTEQGFPAQIRKDGSTTVQLTGSNDSADEQARIKSLADTLDQIGKSSYVESTLIVEGLRPDQKHWIEKAIANAFIRVQVRAVYPSAISETIKVEHDPDLVSISDIRDFLRRDAIDNAGSSRFPSTAEVYIDGADTNLYLPSENDYPNQPMILRDDGGFFALMKRHHVNVLLSGIFWVLSMVSIVNEM